MSFKTRIRALFAVSAALAGAVAFAQPVSTEKVKIVLGYLPLAPTAGVTVVTGAKLWKKYLPNIEIESTEAMSGMPLVNNVVAGKVDIAYFGDMPAIVLGSKRDDSSLLVGITEADEGGSANVYVRTVKELDGKRVSVSFGAYTHRFTEIVSQQEKVSFKFVGQSPEVGLTSLQTGAVDAYITWPPYGPLAVYRGFGKKIADGTKYNFGSVRCIVVSKAFAEKHPQIVVGWMRAELDAHRVLRERPKAAASLIYDAWKRYDVPMEVVTQGFDYTSYPDDISARSRTVLTDGAGFLLEHKLIAQAPDFKAYIDDSFLRKAAAIPSQLDLSQFSD
jgi:NitT/TauT family transport system substrate-binding protein